MFFYPLKEFITEYDRMDFFPLEIKILSKDLLIFSKNEFDRGKCLMSLFWIAT